MRNAVIGLVFVAILGAAGVLGWMAWQNMQRDPAGGIVSATENVSTVPENGNVTDSVVGERTEADGETESDDTAAAEAVADSATGALAERFQFAYLWNNRLSLWSQGDDQGLTTADASHPPRLSHDGRLLAFARDGGLWVLSIQDGQERLLVSEFEIEGMGNGEDRGRLHRFEWLPDTRHLIFNTASDIEVGLALTNDLYRVDAEGLELIRLLAPGQGGEFALAPGGRSIAVVAPAHIRFVDWDGNRERADFSFAPVQTHGSFAYYPQPVWAHDGSRVVVAIPDSDGFLNPQEPASIWSVPVDGGQPALLAQIQAGAPSYWLDPTLTHIAYFQVVTDADAGPVYALQIARLDSADAELRFEGVGQFVGWSPTGSHFMVSTPGEAHSLHLGSLAEAGLVPLDGLYYAFTHQAMWVDAGHFLVAGVNETGTEVALGALDGELKPVLSMDGGAFTFHVGTSVTPADAKP